jgi:hypothetical protein
MKRGAFYLTALTLFALAMTVAVAFQAARNRHPARKAVIDEDRPIGRGPKVLISTLDGLKRSGVKAPAFAAELASEVFPMGDYTFENTAQVVMVSNRIRTGARSGPGPAVNLMLFQPVVVISTGQSSYQASAQGTGFRVKAIGSSDSAALIPIPNAYPTSFSTGRPGPSIFANGTDNQVLKLKDGSLLAMRASIYWGDVNPKPAWWNTVQIQGSPKGARVGTMCWTSSDGRTWKSAGFVDPLATLKGRYAVPRPKPQEPDGCPDGCYGGFDRMEAYADPYTGYVYSTSSATGGALFDSSGKQVEGRADTTMLWRSTDSGKTWEMIFEFGAWTPIVMTSTPDGRLYLYSCVGLQPTLWFGQPMGGTSMSFHGPFNVGLTNVPVGADDLYGALVYKATNSIARVSADASGSKVRISYPYQNSDGRTSVAFANVTIPAGAAATPQATLAWAVDPAKGATILASAFIDGDAAAAAMKSNTALFYWIEGSGTAGASPPDGSARVMGMLFRGEHEVSDPIEIGTSFSPNYSQGHYTGSGSFVELGRQKFFVHWGRQDGLFGRVVAVKGAKF